MENDFLDKVLEIRNRNDWREMLSLNEKSRDKKALKVLWAWPEEKNLEFLKKVLKRHDIRGVTSLGCGCGLLEWIIQESTEIHYFSAEGEESTIRSMGDNLLLPVQGLPVVGFEINKEWWESKYSVPAFIPLRYVEEGVTVDCNPTFALLFCYFNNGAAFREYVDNYRGNMVIIIGAHDGSGRHTDPQPFSADFGRSKWQLLQHQEIKDTKDFIAVYSRQKT